MQHGIGDVRLGEVAEPRAAPGEVLVRIQAVTICASDIHVYAEGNVGGVGWDRPFVPGHEAAGVVEDSNGTGIAEGTKVVLDPAAACYGCDMCQEGRYHLCRNLRFLDLPPVQGAMRELVAWPADRVFALPASVDVVEAPLIEPLCVAVHALELGTQPEGATVAVLGCGAIGLFTVQMAGVKGAARILATEVIEERLALAGELGAEVTVPAGRADPVEEILGATEGRGADLVFEAAGTAEAFEQALAVVRPAGEVVVIGIPSKDEHRMKASEVRRRELTLRWVRRQNENYPEAIELVRQGKIRLSPLLTHRFPAAQAKEAFDLAERKADGSVRVAVVF